MSATTDAKLHPTEEQTISSESKSAQQEVDTTTDAQATGGDKGKTSYTDMATSAATSAATTASAAAVGVKDNVFSMFGGGAKKERKEEIDVPEDRSGSSKAKKDDEAAVAETEGEVSLRSAKQSGFFSLLNVYFARRATRHLSPRKYTMSRWCFSPKKSKRRPTRSRRSRRSKCAPSSSSSTGTAESGRSEAQVM